jgi:hypothetical protein
MIADAIARVRATWLRALHAPGTPADALHASFAAHAPGVVALLADAGVVDPGEELLAWIDYAVDALATPELLPGLAAAVEAFGHEHARPGVHPGHFRQALDALDRTLATLLGDAYDAATRAAWALVYGELAGALARGVGAARPGAGRARPVRSVAGGRRAGRGARARPAHHRRHERVQLAPGRGHLGRVRRAERLRDGLLQHAADERVVLVPGAVAGVAPPRGDALRHQHARVVGHPHQLGEHVHELPALGRHVHVREQPRRIGVDRE